MFKTKNDFPSSAVFKYVTVCIFGIYKQTFIPISKILKEGNSANQRAAPSEQQISGQIRRNRNARVNKNYSIHGIVKMLWTERHLITN